MVERVEARLAHALQVREAVARAASALGR